MPSAPDLGCCGWLVLRGLGRCRYQRTWCEHATGPAHVTKCSLTSTVGTTTRDTRDTCHSTTCSFILALSFSNFSTVKRLLQEVMRMPIERFQTSLRSSLSDFAHVMHASRTSTPRLSRSLMTGLLAHSIGLPLVLRHTSVYAPAIHSLASLSTSSISSVMNTLCES